MADAPELPSTATEADLGGGSGGVWTRAAALRVLSEGTIRRRLEDEVWQVLWPGVYADGGHEPAAVQRAWAAVLASGGEGQPPGGRRSEGGRLRAVASGRTAARVHGLVMIDDDDPATGSCQHLDDDVKVWSAARRLVFPPPGEPPRADGFLVEQRPARTLHRHRSTLAGTDLARLPSGLWLTALPRTIADCAVLLEHEALVCLLDDALHRGLLDDAALRALAAARRGLVGGPALARAVAVADGRAESPGETLARLLLAPVLPGLEPQVELYDRALRLVARFDLGDRDVRMAVECDGKRGHAGGRMVAKDRRRDRVSDGLGWTTERVTWFELRRQQDAVRSRLVGCHERLRCRAPRQGPSQ